MQDRQITDADLASAAWRTAAASSSEGACVEIAHLPGGHVGVRDSKDHSLAPHVFTAHEWACFLDGVHKGEFDLPT